MNSMGHANGFAWAIAKSSSVSGIVNTYTMDAHGTRAGILWSGERGSLLSRMTDGDTPYHKGERSGRTLKGPILFGVTAFRTDKPVRPPRLEQIFLARIFRTQLILPSFPD